MARYPDADGFLWTNDDVMLSYWKLLEADTTKLWMPNDPHSKETRRFKYELVQDGKNVSPLLHAQLLFNAWSRGSGNSLGALSWKRLQGRL